MKFTPHPAAIAAISAETGRRLQSSDRDDAGRTRPRTALPQPYTAEGVAAYRFPDGRIWPAHDMYAPQHPEGSEPGLARIHYEVRHHANDSSSYHPNILTFKSVADLEAEGVRVDPIAAALVIDDKGKWTLMISRDEEMMASAINTLEDGAKVIRAPIRHVDFRDGGDIRHILATYTSGGGLEIFAASSEATLHAALTERYGFIEKADDLNAFCDNLREHAQRHGWIMSGPDDVLLDPTADMETPQI